MIVRLIVVDPSPRPGESDILVYQVPEGSRAEELLCLLLEGHSIEWVKIESKRKAKPSVSPSEP